MANSSSSHSPSSRAMAWATNKNRGINKLILFNDFATLLELFSIFEFGFRQNCDAIQCVCVCRHTFGSEAGGRTN